MALETVLYNPALLSPAATALGQSLRRRLALRLLEALRRIGKDGAPQHRLLLGLPGSGKTMLLRALRSAIEADPELAAGWIPLTFPEAQWDIAHPSDLWVNALDYLAVVLERRVEPTSQAHAERLRAGLARLPRDDEDRRNAAAIRLLNETSDLLGRRFVLLVDQLDLVLGRLKGDQWHIREVLSAESRLLIIGASARAMEATYRYDAAFYDFFEVHELRAPPASELPTLIAELAAHPDRDALLGLYEGHPATWSATIDLIGTQPRALIALAIGLRLGVAPNAADLVAATLDTLTPTMLARIEHLPPQTQRIVHALAAHWHPVRAAVLAERTRLPASAVSAQLHRLVQDGLVERVPIPTPSPTDAAVAAGTTSAPRAPRGTQRFVHQLLDRQLQVWLLLRMGQPHRRRLLVAAAALEALHAGRPLPLDLGPADALAWTDPTIPGDRLAPELRGALERARNQL